MSLTIRALCVGRVFGLPKPSFTYLRGLGQTLDLPLITFVIEGGEYPIVVDTGADVDRAWDLHRIKMEQDEAEKPDVALRSVDVEPDDVRTVVNTHLHWDHSSNNHLFPNAQVIVQRSELEYARRPVPWHRVHFEALPDCPPAAWRRGESQLSPIDGDTEIAPGVSAVTLSGHTPGSQGVLVETAGGRYLIAGDCLYLYENWEGDDQVDHIPVGLYTDLVAYDESLRKIESLDCQVIPSHDFRVLDRQPFS
jgi:N-acyl homoserine lactone hydrolase